MIPKSVERFSDKIMRKKAVSAATGPCAVARNKPLAALAAGQSRGRRGSPPRPA
jgi:hypothetical protein